MTKFEELKAAYEAATPGEWESKGFNDIGRYVETASAGEICSLKSGKYNDIPKSEYQHNAKFIALAHNLMPTLLEAVDLLETLRYSMSQYDDGDWFLHEGGEDVVGKVDEFLEKLK